MHTLRVIWFSTLLSFLKVWAQFSVFGAVAIEISTFMTYDSKKNSWWGIHHLGRSVFFWKFCPDYMIVER